jgi:hypothetical protein
VLLSRFLGFNVQPSEFEALPPERFEDPEIQWLYRTTKSAIEYHLDRETGTEVGIIYFGTEEAGEYTLYLTEQESDYMGFHDDWEESKAEFPKREQAFSRLGMYLEWQKQEHQN